MKHFLAIFLISIFRLHQLNRGCCKLIHWFISFSSQIHLIDCSFVSANLLASDRIFFADLNERIFQNPPHHQNKHKNQEGKLEKNKYDAFGIAG